MHDGSDTRAILGREPADLDAQDVVGGERRALSLDDAIVPRVAQASTTSG